MRTLILVLAISASTAHGDVLKSINCDYDWDIGHEFPIAINIEAPVDNQQEAYHALVGFGFPSRVANPTPNFQPEIISFHNTYLCDETHMSFDIQFENGAYLDASGTIVPGAAEQSELHGTYSPNGFQDSSGSKTISCSLNYSE